MTEDLETSTFTLFNLNNDPFETEEVFVKYPNEVSKLKARLEQWKQETRYEAPKPSPEYKG